jgi:hypothetical protein
MPPGLCFAKQQKAFLRGGTTQNQTVRVNSNGGNAYNHKAAPAHKIRLLPNLDAKI